jgi:transcriptional regulator with XRE-family HTH domain
MGGFNSREELITSKEYILSKIQIDLFSTIREFINDKKLSQTKFAEKLGVSKGYVSQVLNGNFDHKISKLVDLSLAADKVPVINFIPIEDYLLFDKHNKQKTQLDNSIINNKLKKLV